MVQPPPPPFSATSPFSPTSTHVSLPDPVEQLIAKICTEKSVLPPDYLTRQELHRLGEFGSLNILGDIASSSRVHNFSAFIMHMAKNSQIAMAHNSLGLSPPDGDDKDTSSVDLEMVEREPIPSDKRVLSPQMKALGDFEFRRAFLILSYLGRAKLEETVPMELLGDLTSMPIEEFEFHIWNKFGIKNIKPSDRRQILDWDIGKTHVYHCHVDLQGEVTFKGPFLESTKTHLQRVLGDENILQVKFEDVSQEKKSHFDFDNYYCNVYQRIAEQGIELGLRRITLEIEERENPPTLASTVYKDGGKEEKKKSGTKSSVKCYFVCTSSGWDRDQNNYFHYGKTINQIRLSFMHIHTVPSLAKYISRLSLIVSKTLKLDIDLSDPELKVETIPDIHCKDGSTELKGIHTDGTGFISEDLALQCPIYVSNGNIQAGRKDKRLCAKRHKIYSNDGLPLLMQVRLFYNGLCAKGTLLVNRLLPKKTIQIRPSMIKVEPDPSMLGIVQPFNSLEVVNTRKPFAIILFQHLSKESTPVKILDFTSSLWRGSSRVLGLLSTALAEAKCCHYDRGTALKVALNNEGIDNDRLMARMIMSGMPLDEPFLQYRLGFMMGEERKSLQAGKIPISDSYYLMGTTDPTGELRANQVCVILDKGQVSGDVLVYKHPGLHPGDIHLLQATFVKGLEKVVEDSKYAIFFPAVGPRSLADEMANSDFDGDIYWVSRHPELLKNFKPSPPWLALEEDSSKKGAVNKSLANMNSHEVEKLLFRSFLNNRFKPSYTVGLAAECWLVYMDCLLTPGVEKEEVWSKIEKLINIFYDALDAPKTGKKVEVGKDLKVVKYPHFMEKKVDKKDFEYNSISILGLIYDKVQSFKAQKLQLTNIGMLPCLSVQVPKNCMDKWGGLYDKYLKEMREALEIQEKDMKNNRCQEIIDCYKKILYGTREFEERTRPKDQIENEALAIYQIVYEKAQTADKVEKCGFAWKVAGSVLCKYYASSQEGDDNDDMFHGSFKVLHELLG